MERGDPGEREAGRWEGGRRRDRGTCSPTMYAGHSGSHRLLKGVSDYSHVSNGYFQVGGDI